MGRVLLSRSGTFLKTTPIATEMKVIKLSAATEPVKLSHLPTRMAKSAAMKKVLSPISEANIKANAAKQPDLPTGELATYSCTAKGNLQQHVEGVQQECVMTLYSNFLPGCERHR